MDFGKIPAWAPAMVLAARSMMEADQGRKNAGLDVLARTMVGYSGPAGGFTLKTEWAKEVFDKARTVDGPLARCRVFPVAQRSFNLPVYNEASRAFGHRWGGAQGYWGTSEISDLSLIETQPAAALINFDLKRLIVSLQPMSRDLLQDTDLIMPLLDYACASELRFQIEQAMVQGALGGPSGVVAQGGGGPATGVVQIAKDGGQSAGTISETNITNLSKALYGPCKRNAIWSLRLGP